MIIIHEQLNFLEYGYGYGWDTHNWQYTRDNRNIRVSNRQYTRQPALEYIEIKFLLFLHVFSFISNEYDKIKCFKKSVFGYIVSYGYPTRTHTHTRGNSVAHVWWLSSNSIGSIFRNELFFLRLYPYFWILALILRIMCSYSFIFSRFFAFIYFY